jgi:hypothetical protein
MKNIPEEDARDAGLVQSRDYPLKFECLKGTIWIADHRPTGLASIRILLVLAKWPKN